MSLKFFERKRRCIGTFLKSGEGVLFNLLFSIILFFAFYVSAFSGFGSTFVVGTDKGRVLVFGTKGGVHWENEAALEGLGYDESSQEPITQICCASALDLILLLVGEELVGLEMKDEFRVLGLCSSVSRCAINSHPSLDDPFAVQLAVAHSQKSFVHIGTVADAEFVGGRKVPTVGRVVKMAFSGNCLCYSTDAGAFYVQNVQAKGGEALKLFDGATDGHAICTFGTEEFALSGIHELVVFVNVHGVSSRPPISVSGQSPIVGIALKEPFLHVLSEDGTISIFSIIDDQLVQLLVFPTDGVQNSDQKTRSRISACQLENVDGTILIASPGDSSLFELVPVSAAVQIDEQIQLGNLNCALSMIEKSAVFCSKDVEIMEMGNLRKKLGFMLLQNANFSDGVALLSSIDGTDCAIAFISLVIDQRRQLGMAAITQSVQTQLPTDGCFPEIPLEFVKQYLEETVHQINASPSEDCQFDSLFSCCLARTFALLEDFDALLRHSDAEWNSAEFRRWLSTELRRPKWAAKLAVERHCWTEAFDTWKGQIGSNGGQQMGQEENEMAEECYATLFKVEKYSEMAAALPWLVPMNAKICMEAIDALDSATNSSDEKCPPEEIVKLFQNSEPKLLLRYLDARIYELGIPSLHDKLLELYVHFICNDNFQNETENEYRQKLRHFLLFSDRFSTERAADAFGDEKSGKFRIEAILAEANVHNAVDCLQKLMSSAAVGEDDFDQQQQKRIRKDLFSAGQILCTRFPSPEMLTTMLTLHLQLSASDPTLRANVTHILALLDSTTDAVTVLRNVPDNLRSSAFVRSFLCRHVAQRTNTDQWRKMRRELAAREQSRAVHELGSRSAGTKFCIDEQTKCGICERRLKADDAFVRQPNNGQLTHLRCFNERKSIG